MPPEGRFQAGIVHNQGPGNAVPDGLGLGVYAAAGYAGYQLETVVSVGNPEGFIDDHLPGQPVEVVLHQLAVDQHRPAVGSGVEAHPRDGRLAFSRTVEILLLSFRLHQSSKPSLISFSLFGQLTDLGLMGMSVAGVHLEPLEHIPAQLVAGQHTLNRQLQHPVGVGLEHIPQDK